MSKKIVVITAGGTIGSTRDAQGRVRPATGAQWIQNLVAKENLDVQITFREAFNLLSENMQPHHWTRIGRVVMDSILQDRPYGIVVTHGTETMAYTAAALSFILNNLTIPVVLTGASQTACLPTSNAISNLVHGIRVASHPKAPAEVCVVFSHRPMESLDYYAKADPHHLAKQSALIIRGTRARKTHGKNHSMFHSINAPPLGKIYKSKVSFSTKMFLRKRRLQQRPFFENKIGFKSNVALLRIYPGIRSQELEAFAYRGYQGIILEGYGDGTMPCSDSYTLGQAIAAVRKQGCFVFVTAQPLGLATMATYEGGEQLQQAGAIPLHDMTSEAALVKLMWAFGNQTKMSEIPSLMLENLAGEISTA